MKYNIENHIRSFGMSGFLITSELREIEKKFNLELGHSTAETSDKESDYYPQFELHVRAEASEMAAHYEAFYCLEKSIRTLISESLEEEDGELWWSSGRIDKGISAEVQKRIEKETDSGVTRRSFNEIDYTTFGELSVIIIANWDVFGSIFNSRKAVEKVMNNLNTLRGPVAHCSPLSEDEIIRLRLTVRDWFRMMQ